MRIISRKPLKEFYSDPAHKDAEAPCTAWFKEVEKADWETPNQVKEHFGNASILKDGRAVFNIGGNKYRIVAWINYDFRVVYIRFVGTHEEYDGIDAQTI